MNMEKLYEILTDSTVQLRTCDPFVEDEIKNEAGEKIFDCHFLKIGVDPKALEKHKSEFIALMDDFPEPQVLQSGPSYIHVGAILGDQGAAFQMFAFGEAAGLWEIITPAKLGISGPQANQMAGTGFVMITGYQPNKKVA